MWQKKLWYQNEWGRHRLWVGISFPSNQSIRHSNIILRTGRWSSKTRDLWEGCQEGVTSQHTHQKHVANRLKKFFFIFYKIVSFYTWFVNLGGFCEVNADYQRARTGWESLGYGSLERGLAIKTSSITSLPRRRQWTVISVRGALVPSIVQIYDWRKVNSTSADKDEHKTHSR
jgi:hypothetical protein